MKTKTHKTSPSLRAHFGGLPSAALRAMVAGLLDADKDPSCRVRMSTFGVLGSSDGEDTLCFGCAATWTVQRATGRTLAHDEVEYLGDVCSAYPPTAPGIAGERWTAKDVAAFESAMDEARSGFLRPLFRYMRKKGQHGGRFDFKFALTTGGWREQLPKVRKLIKDLETKGL